MEVVLPTWLEAMANKAATEESWPNGDYPEVAFRAREIIYEECADDDAFVSFLQRLIDEVERLRAIVPDNQVAKLEADAKVA